MKQFNKAIPKDGDYFKYLCKKFPGLYEAKLKEGIFVVSDIRKLMKDKEYEIIMVTKEKEAWVAFKDFVSKFLGNYKDPNYKPIVMNFLRWVAS